MLDRLLVSLGSAAIGGALVYFLWSFATRGLSRLRVRRAARPADADPPATPDETTPATPPESHALADIRDSLAELARAQVSMMERLEETEEDRRADDEDPNEARFVALSAKIEALSGADTALADALEALGRRLGSIEEGVRGLGPGEDAEDRDAAMAEAMEALADRLERVEGGLGSVLKTIETAGSATPDAQAQADALRAALESVLPSDALPALETRLATKLGALSERIEAAVAPADEAAGAQLAERFDGLETQLAAAADQRAAERETLDALTEGLSNLLHQLERPAEVAFSEAALAELQDGLRDASQVSEQGHGAVLAEAMAGLDARLDAMQTRLDTLASDRSGGRTLEMIGAISTLQTDTARLKGGIEQGMERIRDAATDSAERISALDDRLAALEAHLAAVEPAGSEAVTALTRKLEQMTPADLRETLAGALQAERALLAESIAGMLAARLMPTGQAERPERGPEPPAQPPLPEPVAPTHPSAGPAAPADIGNAGANGADSPPAPSREAFGLSPHPRDTADLARAESALLRSRPGLATVIGRHAPNKPNGGDV